MFYCIKTFIQKGFSLFVIGKAGKGGCAVFDINPYFHISLGPVYEFVCVSFTTGNLNCFRVK